MTRPPETWIALALAVCAIAGAAVAFAPRPNHLEESCVTATPPGDAVALRAADDVVTRGGVATRTIVFTPDVSGARVVLHACRAQDARVERDAPAATVRVVLTAHGEEPDVLVEAAEVRMRGVLVDGALHVHPRVQLHGRETLPRLQMTLTLPSGLGGHVEARP